MLIAARPGCMLLAILFSAAAALAQQPSAAAPPASDKIYLNVVVSPKTGAADIGLQQQDFTILDSNVPKTITSFEALTGRDAPPEVVLIIDAVNGGYRAVVFEHSELDRFLRAEGGRLAFSSSIGVFTDRGIEMLGDFSTDGNALSAALDQNNSGLRVIGSSGGLAGAAERWKMSLAALRQLTAAEERRPGRKIMIWISPGWRLLANASAQFDSKLQQQIFADIVNISTRLMKARTTLYSVDPIGTGESVIRAGDYKPYLKPVTKSDQVNLADLALQVLAIQSGGLVITSTNDLAKALQTCLADATPSYEISFAPSPATKKDEYHQLEVKIAKPGLTARTRQGYYTQPQAHN